MALSIVNSIKSTWNILKDDLLDAVLEDEVSVENVAIGKVTRSNFEHIDEETHERYWSRPDINIAA